MTVQRHVVHSMAAVPHDCHNTTEDHNHKHPIHSTHSTISRQAVCHVVALAPGPGLVVPVALGGSQRQRPSPWSIAASMSVVWRRFPVIDGPKTHCSHCSSSMFSVWQFSSSELLSWAAACPDSWAAVPPCLQGPCRHLCRSSFVLGSSFRLFHTLAGQVNRAQALMTVNGSQARG